MANPSLLESFAESGTNKAAPSPALEADGYSFEEILASENYNYMMEQLYAAGNKSKIDGIWDWESDYASGYNQYSLVRHNGRIWESDSDSNTTEPGISGWTDYQLKVKTGQKNIFINGNKLIDQRGSGGGGLKQVAEANMNAGGSYTFSWTGTATATIYEFPALLADFATTIADVGTNTLASTVSTGTTVSTTASYYIAIVFSSTDFNFVQAEQGTVATNFEFRHNELDLCLPFYEFSNDPTFIPNYGVTNGEDDSLIGTIPFKAVKRATPVIGNLTQTSMVSISALNISVDKFSVTGEANTASVAARCDSFTADASIFGTTETQKEDGWFV